MQRVSHTPSNHVLNVIIISNQHERNDDVCIVSTPQCHYSKSPYDISVDIYVRTDVV